jgi:hypothetical protein
VWERHGIEIQREIVRTVERSRPKSLPIRKDEVDAVNAFGDGTKSEVREAILPEPERAIVKPVMSIWLTTHVWAEGP